MQKHCCGCRVCKGRVSREVTIPRPNATQRNIMKHVRINHIAVGPKFIQDLQDVPEGYIQEFLQV